MTEVEELSLGCGGGSELELRPFVVLDDLFPKVRGPVLPRPDVLAPESWDLPDSTSYSGSSSRFVVKSLTLNFCILRYSFNMRMKDTH